MAEFEHNSEKFGYISLDDLEGVQTALSKLGYDPGVADGKDGPHTRAAVTKFQQAAAIKVDGIAGPETKGALRSTLDQQASPPPTAAP
ncbi:MAG: peptidoglycan-binding domain-containing protein [Myxococcales bacterium]|jgi:peptidoglycan hydrolase-like protein with peptidoglycan-binding domain